MRIDPTPSVRFAIAGLALLAAGLLAATCGESVRVDCPACGSDPIGTGCPFAATASSGSSSPKVLVLSGGGSHGAFGAGLLHGWGTLGTRPTFDMVTGISTGALLATHAFLGNRDGELKDIFTTTSTPMVYTYQSNPLGSNALQSREPLKQLIDHYVTDARIVEVAQQTGRELLVGTVNLDTSQFCPWSLSQIALKAEAAGIGTTKGDCYFDLFRDVVWAASGAPVIAPPVPLDPPVCEGAAPNPHPALHVDGGARLRVFAEQFLASMMGTAEIYVIVNGKLVLHPVCVGNWIGSIAMRTLEMGNSEAMLGSLLYLQERFKGLTWNLKLAHVPDDYCVDFGNDQFDPPKMTALFERGVLWTKTLPWETSIPDKRVAPWPTACPAAMLRGCTQP